VPTARPPCFSNPPLLPDQNVWLPTVLAALTIGGGALGMLAWWVDPSGLASMKVTTGLSFLLLGGALWWQRRRDRPAPGTRVIGLLPWLVVVLTGLTLMDYLLPANLGFGQILARAGDTDPAVAAPGRLSFATAQALLCLGLALVLLDWSLAPRLYPAELLALLGTLAGLVGLLGHLFGVAGLYQFSPYSTMPLHTSLLLVGLGIGIMAVRPQRGLVAVLTSNWIGGAWMRRLFPVGLTAIIGLAWLRLLAERAGWFPAVVGTTILVTLMVVGLAVALWVVGHQLNLLHARLQCLAAIVESSDDAIISKDLTGRIISWNAGAERLFGYTSDEMVGQNILRLIPDEQQSEERYILTSIRLGERVVPYATRRRRSDGDLIRVMVSISPVRDFAGNIVGASKIARLIEPGNNQDFVADGATNP